MLQLTNKLISKLKKSSVSYCHWKSNELLRKAVNGETDLDLLVKRGDGQEFENVLNKLNFKRVISESWFEFSGVENWMGFDENTGKLIHLHVHYKLNTGRTYSKPYQITIENEILSNAHEEPKYKIKIPAPEHQFLIFVLRLGMKLSVKRICKMLVTGKVLTASQQEEFEFILSLFENKDIEKKLSNLNLKDDKIKALQFLFRQNFSGRIFVLKKIFKVMSSHVCRARFTFLASFIRYWTRYTKSKSLGLMEKLGFGLKPRKKIHTGGFIVSITGADGAGKSSLVNQLTSWLRWKIDANSMYLGVGQGRLGFLGTTYKILRSFKNKFSSQNQTISGGEKLNKKNKSLGLIPSCKNLLKYLVSRERVRKIQKAVKIQSQGKIIITDRYPQNSVENYFDGPYTSLGDSFYGLGPNFGKIERELQGKALKLGPDIVIKLKVSFKEAMKRKPDHPEDMIKLKISVLDQINYPKAKTFTVDADKPFPEVLLETKKIIWDFL